ncbi:hypothetical protein [Pedobacter sp. UBA5917]|jgi:hypothetical protein|uniref:hypothetical protein n=1 Tax=Pedobacter sp. UBA5917 TaxID=1947061 RepID=UPI0025F0E0B5|nr:hypothetical protein [Pedobacter sp. UBA5917]
MKKMLFWIIPLIVVVILIIIFKPFKEFFIERNREPLPKEYTGIQPLDEHYNSPDFKVSLLYTVQVSSAASPNPIRIFPSVNNQLIVYCDAQKDEDTKADYQYYKFNNKGVITDSLYIKYDGYWAEFIDDFIMYTHEKGEYYTTWPLNGDTTKKVIPVVNADFHLSEKEMDGLISTSISGSKYYFYKFYVEEGTYIRKFFWYKDQKWTVLYQKVSAYDDIPDELSAGRYRKTVFSSGESDPYLPDNVEMRYFYPEEKMDYAHIIGGGQGGFKVYNWRGKGFFRTHIGGKELDFRVDNLATEKERFDNYKLRLYAVRERNSSAENFRPAFYHSVYGYSFYSPVGDKIYLITKK